jgi:hypothetical protein
MNEKELSEILAKHLKWLDKNDDGERANLTCANLIDANLTGANLFDANLTGANLIDANLTRANLIGANLTGTGVAVSQLGKYQVTCSRDFLRVGCQTHPHEWWYGLTFDRAAKLDANAWDWWITHRDICFAMMRASRRT